VLTGGNRGGRRHKYVPSHLCSHTKLTLSGMGLNPVLSGDEPSSKHLTHGTALPHKTESSYWKVPSGYFHMTVTSTLQKAFLLLPGQDSGRIRETVRTLYGKIESLCQSGLNLILLTWRIWWAHNNASRWQKGFNSAFKELNSDSWTLYPVTKVYIDYATPVGFKG